MALSKATALCRFRRPFGGLAEQLVKDELGAMQELSTLFRGPKRQGPKRKVVLLGTGWAGVSFVRTLDARYYDLTIVSPRPYFFYTPLLAGSVTGTVKFGNILEPIRNYCAPDGAGVRYVKAGCEAVDLGQRRVVCRAGGDPLELEYDELVVSVGCEPNTFGTPGVKEHALFLKELEHGQKVQQQVLHRLEQAAALQVAGAPAAELRAKLRFVVVGGGPTGVELCAELSDFANAEVQSRFPSIAEHVQITLVEATERVLSMFDAPLSEYTVEHLQKRGVEVLCSTQVKEVTEDTCMLASGEVSSVIRHGMVVWVAGVTTRPVTRTLCRAIGEAQPDRRGLVVDDRLRVAGARNVWALGDCAVSGLPPTAQVAHQQGKYLGKLFNRTDLGAADGTAAPPFRYQHLGAMAYVGASAAVAQLPNPLGKGDSDWLSRVRQSAYGSDFKVTGRSGFGLWRSTYLSKMLSARNTGAVALDWVGASLFGRDISAPSMKSI